MTERWRPTAALVVAVGTVAGALGLAALAHRADLVVVAAPFAVAVLVGMSRVPRDGADGADEQASLVLPPAAVWEDDVALVRVTVPADPDVDAIRIGLRHGLGVRARPPGTLLCRRVGEPVEIALRATRWGRVDIGPVVTELTAARGLLRRVGPSAGSKQLTVLPLREVFDAAAIVPRASGLVGTHPSRRRGDGTDLLAVRPFVPGDRIRRITWPVSLRTGHLHVTTTTEDRDAEVQLVVDTATEVGSAGSADATSLDVTVRAAAAIAEHYLRAGDRVGVLDLATTRRPVRLRGGRRHMLQVLATLLDAAPTPQHDRGRSDRRLREIPPRSLVIVFSTLLDDEIGERIAGLTAGGRSVLVVDTLPPGARPPYQHEWTALAWRIALLRRDTLVRRLSSAGVAVVPWQGAGSLDVVLRGLRRSAGAPREVSRR